MPNLVMASAFAMLFLQVFAMNGPVVSILNDWGILDQSYDFLAYTVSARSLIALMNFLMWFGNTTILLMAGIMGIDQTVLESAEVDGANSMQVFFKIVLPLLKPILLFVLITSLIGGIQMFDVPQILTSGNGGPNLSTKTVIMYLYDLIRTSKNYGLAGAVSVILFIITGILSVIVFKAFTQSDLASIEDKHRKVGENA